MSTEPNTDNDPAGLPVIAPRPQPDPEPEPTPKKVVGTLNRTVSFRMDEDKYDQLMEVLAARIKAGETQDMRHLVAQLLDYAHANNFFSGFTGIKKWKRR